MKNNTEGKMIIFAVTNERPVKYKICAILDYTGCTPRFHLAPDQAPVVRGYFTPQIFPRCIKNMELKSC